MACPTVLLSGKIFRRHAEAADAEGIAPLHDLCRDLRQLLLAEDGIAEVGVKIGDRQDHPLAVVLLVGKIVGDQGADDLGRDLFGQCRFDFLYEFRRQLWLLPAQRAELQRIGEDIVKAQRPGALGLGRKNRDLILDHFVSPRGGKLGSNDLRVFERRASHLLRMRQHEICDNQDMTEESAGTVRVHQLWEFRAQFRKVRSELPFVLGRCFTHLRSAASGAERTVGIGNPVTGIVRNDLSAFVVEQIPPGQEGQDSRHPLKLQDRGKSARILIREILRSLIHIQ